MLKKKLGTRYAMLYSYSVEVRVLTSSKLVAQRYTAVPGVLDYSSTRLARSTVLLYQSFSNHDAVPTAPSIAASPDARAFK